MLERCLFRAGEKRLLYVRVRETSALCTRTKNVCFMYAYTMFKQRYVYTDVRLTLISCSFSVIVLCFQSFRLNSSHAVLYLFYKNSAILFHLFMKE